MKRRVPSHLYGDYPGQLAYFTRQLPNGCWEFTGYVLPQGYGQLGQNLPAHRVAWEVAHGCPVPVGLVIDHTCHNRDLGCRADQDCPHRRCVNPAHLEAVPSGVNVARGHGFAGLNDRKTHCAQGHAFTTDNTYMRPDRYGRICRTCREESLRKARMKFRVENRERARERRRAQNPEDFAIRDWAMANGVPCKTHGPISRAVRDAFSRAEVERVKAEAERRSA